MATLPTLTVTQEQADRCLAAFGSVPKYKAWLAGQIRDFILSNEKRALKEAKTAEIRDGLLALNGDDPLEGV